MELLEIRVGDTIKDCDPRTAAPFRTVVEVGADYVRAKGVTVVKIARRRIHAKPERTTGYALVRRG